MGNGSSVVEKAKQAIPALVAPFTEKLQNEGYNISLRIGGPAKKELLDIIQRYHLDKLHHAIIDTGLEWRILAPHEDDKTLQLEILSANGIGLRNGIDAALKEYGNVDHTTYKTELGVIDQYTVAGHPRLLIEVYEGLIYLDEKIHKGEFHYVYDSAWEAMPK